MSINVMDLFCGAGGSSQGAKQAGARVVSAVDAWHLATSTFKDNHRSTSVVTRSLGPYSRPGRSLNHENIDLLLASPECTNHSCAKGARERDESSRRTSNYVLNFACALSPRWVVIENVVQLRNWTGYQPMLQRLRRLGYGIREQVLDAAAFGVAQTRRRLFVLCDRKREPDAVALGRLFRTPRARDIIRLDHDVPGRDLYSDKRAPATIERAERAMSALGKRIPFLIVYYGSDGGGGWQEVDRPLRTVTTLDRFGLVTWRGGNPLLRMLSVDEIRAAMGFPETYRLAYGTRRDRIMMLGNGVCPPVMEAVVRSLVRR